MVSLRSSHYYYHKFQCAQADASYARGKITTMRLQLEKGKVSIAFPLFIYSLWYVHLLNKYERACKQFDKVVSKDK